MSKNELIRKYLSAQMSVTDTVLKRDYEVVEGHSQYGHGDLLLNRGDCIQAIEFAHIDHSQSGKTACRRRTYMRKKVVKQALLYAAFCKVQYPGCRVEAITVTNEKTTKISDDVTIEQAKTRVIQFISDVHMGYIPTTMMPALEELFATLVAYLNTEASSEPPSQALA